MNKVNNVMNRVSAVMNKVNVVIFDFGGVLVDWNPHYLYDAYFGSREKADWFLTHICNSVWNVQMDGGKPFAEGIAERVGEYPEWEKEIRMYRGEWLKMMGGQIPGMQEIVETLKARGCRVYGLTNWAADTFALVRKTYPVFDLLDGIVVSGEEKVAKPDLRIFRILLERYAVNPAEAVFIDDNMPNIEAAREVGLQTIHFESVAQLREALGLIRG